MGGGSGDSHYGTQILFLVRMSKGSGKKKCQKYQNKYSYNATPKYCVPTPQQKSITATELSGLCKRCTDILEWKIKYGKYKSLSVPSKCVRCGGKRVTRAYFILCKECATELHCCAKCQASDVIGAFPDTPEVKAQELNYLKEEMKYLKERERRKLMREISKKGMKVDSTSKPELSEENSEAASSDSDSGESHLDLSDLKPPNSN